MISAAVAAAGGVLAALTIRNPSGARSRTPGEPGDEALSGLHCALDAPPLRPEPETVGPVAPNQQT